MADWWQSAYPGGGPAKLKGFARPLYPPDVPKSSGYSPSPNGPDVQALKRVISRLGRWPWQSFDQTYSNGFAHGTGGNVVNTGIAGFQRQMHIDASGWFGKASFNTLIYCKIPDGLPNAGQMGFDQTAIDLYNQGYDRFKGKNPSPDQPASGKTLRQRALDKATGQLGVKESPAGSNSQKYGSWYGMNGVPWCAIFCTWAFETTANSPAFVKGSRWSYVPYIVSDARANRNGVRTVDPPSAIPGDLVCYDWQWDGVYDHVGIFEKWTDSSTFTAIEGNTSTSNNSNGGQVMRRTRTLGQQGTVMVRVNEP